MKVKCPTCQKEMEWSSQNQYRPFCSHRCRLIDLGEWASENRSIPDQQSPIDEFDLDLGDEYLDPDKLH